MKRFALLISVYFLLAGCGAQTAIPSPEMQIKLAVMAAPAEMRDGAMVYGYDKSGKQTTLRKGSNEMICLADDPKQEGLNVSCFHRDMEPFMKRGQELKTQGKTFQEIFDIREKEVKEGKLSMNKQPSTLYVYSAKKEDFNGMEGTVKKGYLRYVIYIPYATAANTGLPLKPDAPGMPWIMDPGTHRAHIMINPPEAK